MLESIHAPIATILQGNLSLLSPRMTIMHRIIISYGSNFLTHSDNISTFCSVGNYSCVQAAFNVMFENITFEFEPL